MSPLCSQFDRTSKYKTIVNEYVSRLQTMTIPYSNLNFWESGFSQLTSTKRPNRPLFMSGMETRDLLSSFVLLRWKRISVCRNERNYEVEIHDAALPGLLISKFTFVGRARVTLKTTVQSKLLIVIVVPITHAIGFCRGGGSMCMWCGVVIFPLERFHYGVMHQSNDSGVGGGLHWSEVESFSPIDSMDFNSASVTCIGKTSLEYF